MADALEQSPPLSSIIFSLPEGENESSLDLKTLYYTSAATTGASAAKVLQASNLLAAALADPLRGPETIFDFYTSFGETPTFAEMCRLLAPESRLKSFFLGEGSLDNDGAVALADALASGRSRLIEYVHIGGGDISAGGGCVLRSLEKLQHSFPFVVVLFFAAHSPAASHLPLYSLPRPGLPCSPPLLPTPPSPALCFLTSVPLGLLVAQQQPLLSRSHCPATPRCYNCKSTAVTRALAAAAARFSRRLGLGRPPTAAAA